MKGKSTDVDGVAPTVTPAAARTGAKRSMQACVCPRCGSAFECATGAVNRAKKIGAPRYCGKACSGLARRLVNPPTEAERIAAKSAYDAARREKLRDRLRAEKRAHYQANRDRILVEMKAYRKIRMPKHVKYCRQPKYKAWKAEYDKEYRAKSDFGPFWEAAMVLAALEREIGERATFTEIAIAKGTLNKATQRKRDYEKHLNGH